MSIENLSGTHPDQLDVIFQISYAFQRLWLDFETKKGRQISPASP